MTGTGLKTECPETWPYSLRIQGLGFRVWGFGVTTAYGGFQKIGSPFVGVRLVRNMVHWVPSGMKLAYAIALYNPI